MPRELLNGAGGRPARRQVRTEGVSQHVDPSVRDLRATRCAPDVLPDDLLRQRRAVGPAHDPLAA